MAINDNKSLWQITRRDFLAASVGALAGLGGGCAFGDKGAAKPFGGARFGMLTDVHYADVAARGNRHYRKSLAKVAECVELMNKEKVDFLIELGDFKDQAAEPDRLETIEYLKEIEAIYKTFNGPRHHVLGNHDMDSITKEDFLSNVTNTGVSSKKSYYSFDRNGLHVIVLDANFKSNGEAYASGNFDWRDANICSAQLKWLKLDLAGTKKPTVTFCHQAPGGDGAKNIKNSAELRSVLENSRKVIALFNGHHHGGGHALINDIHYYTLKGVVEGSAPSDSAYAIVEVKSDYSTVVNGYRKVVSTDLSTGKLLYKMSLSKSNSTSAI